MKVVRIIFIVFVASLVARFLTGGFNTYEVTPEANANTAKNSAKVQFVNSCVDEGVKTNNPNATESFCECAFNALDNHFDNEWYADTTLINRVVKEGYNYEETQAIVNSCVKSI